MKSYLKTAARLVGFTLIAPILHGCVSNKAVQTARLEDQAMSCESIRAEVRTLSSALDDAKKDSGLTKENIGLALVFWPGIIVNEMRANDNQESIDGRIVHLNSLYARRCESPS